MQIGGKEKEILIRTKVSAGIPFVEGKCSFSVADISYMKMKLPEFTECTRKLRNTTMILSRELRYSKTFTKVVVCVATFTDIFVYGLAVPVLPFALLDRVKIPDHDVQYWTSFLLGTYSVSSAIGSSMAPLIPG